MERDYLMAGMRRQRDLLNEILSELEWKEKLDIVDYYFYETRTGEVLKSLKDLRSKALGGLIQNLPPLPEAFPN